MKSHTEANRSLTVRLPAELHRAAKAVAARRRQSMNVLVQEALQMSVEQEEQRELETAFALLARSPDECDVEYAFEAQSEAIFRDEP